MDIVASIHEQLKEVEKLEQDLENFPKPISIDTLKEDNAKLLSQLAALEKAVDTAANKFNTHSASILAALVAIFDKSIKTAFPDIKKHQVLLNPCTNPKFGDYQCNSAMSLSKILEETGIQNHPKEIASKIIENIIECGLIAKCEVAPAGFINIFLHRDFVAGEIVKIITHGVMPPKLRRKRVLIDYSSPNIAKEMHVGHLRSTIIGDCLARLLRFFKFDVLAINHIGDWGTQFGMLIAHLQEIFPLYTTESPPIGDLAAFYKQAKLRFDEEPEFKKRAYDSVVRLQSHDPDSLTAWKLICEVSRREFERIYERLGVHGLVERGESFYQDHMERLVAELEQRALLEDDDGKRVLRSPTSPIHMLMVKSDGGFTYDTSDMAALRHRIEEERVDAIIYVVDSGQSSHFEGLLAAAQHIGLYEPARHRIEHVGFGVVLGSDRKKFKSRANETVRLADLLDQGLERAAAKLREKERHLELSEQELQRAQHAVAYGCIKYADLSHHRIKEYIFSFDKMLEDKGNTAVYLLYTYTRISGIARSAKVSQDQLREYVAATPLVFQHDKEWKLARAVTRLPEVLMRMYEDLLPHSLCDYLYELCCTFTEFYEACYCVEKDKATGAVVSVNMWRVVLAEATAAVLRAGFDILGLDPVERM